MNDKNRAFINKVLYQLRYALYLNMWEMTCTYPSTDKPTEDGNLVAADITTDHSYHRLTINIYPVFWKHSKKEQIGILVHELSHVITDVLGDLVFHLQSGKLVTERELTEARERATSWVENIILGLMEKPNLEISKLYRK